MTDKLTFNELLAKQMVDLAVSQARRTHENREYLRNVNHGHYFGPNHQCACGLLEKVYYEQRLLYPDQTCVALRAIIRKLTSRYVVLSAEDIERLHKENT